MGKYLEIVSVDAPSEASYGVTVTVNVYVKNKWTDRIFAIVTGAYDTAPVYSTSHYIEPGKQRIFGLSFAMPSKSVDLWVWAWYWTATGNWSASPDDQYGPVQIALAGAQPPAADLAAEIREIKVFDENHAAALPPQPTEQGKMLSIWFKAYSLASQLTIYFDAKVRLRKPSGKVEEKSDVSYLPYTPGAAHHFKFNNQWKADEIGTYYATIILNARGSLYGSSQEVDRETNVKVFTVSEAPEGPEPTPDVYKGEIRNKMVDWTNIVSGAKPFPLAEPAPVGENMRISFEGYNLSDISMRLRGEVWIYGPNKRETYHAADVSTLTYTKGAAHKFTFPKAPAATPIDEEGEWTIKIQLTNSTGQYLLAEYDGALFTAEPPPSSMWTVIAQMMPLVMLMMMFGMMIPMVRDVAGESEEGEVK